MVLKINFLKLSTFQKTICFSCVSLLLLPLRLNDNLSGLLLLNWPNLTSTKHGCELRLCLVSF